MKKEIFKGLIDIGFILISFIMISVLISTVTQLINVDILSINIVLSFILAIAGYLIFRRKENIIYKSLCILTTIIAFIVSLIVACNIFDISYDANYYHKPAIGMIKEGFNPFYNNTYDFLKETIPEIADEKVALWIDHYPKASWQFGAAMYSLTGNIEAGKLQTLLVMLSALCLTIGYLGSRFYKFWQATIIGLVLACSPIVLSQMFAYYVDGLMAILIYMNILLLLMIYDKKYTDISMNEKWIYLMFVIGYAMNLKFTGVFFTGIFSLMFYLYNLFINRKNKELLKIFINDTVRFVVVVIFGIVIIGSNSYIKNTVDHLNPLYPLIGNEDIDIVTTMQPQVYGKMNRVEKLFNSIFSKSENVTYYSEDKPQLKTPFTFTKEEVDNIGIADIRIGGFGVLYSGIFILTIILILNICVYFFKNKNDSVIKYLFLIIFAIIIITCVLEEAWWARYSPQIYLLTIIAIAGNLYICNKKNINKIVKVCTYIVLAITLIAICYNSLVFIKHRYLEFKSSRITRNDLEYIKDKKLDIFEINIDTESKKGILYNLKDFDINYKIVEENKEFNKYTYSWQIRFKEIE